MPTNKYKRIVTLIPEQLYPEIEKKMRNHGFTSMSGYIRYLLIRELRRQRKR